MIFLMHFLFLVILAINYSQNKGLRLLNSEISGLKTQLDDKLHIFDEIKLLNSKIVVFQRVENSVVPYSEYLETIDSSVFSGVVVSNIKSEDKKVSLTVKSDTALNAAKLIGRLLEFENVSEVILSAASLDKSSGGYNVSLGVVYK